MANPEHLAQLNGMAGVECVAAQRHRDTLFRSGGLPEEFMRGCGVPEEFIAYANSLVGTPIDCYSCFISYKSKDDAFARQLHRDLQAKKIRVWFAPEDLKIGTRSTAPGCSGRSRSPSSARIARNATSSSPSA